MLEEETVVVAKIVDLVNKSSLRKMQINEDVEDISLLECAQTTDSHKQASFVSKLSLFINSLYGDVLFINSQNTDSFVVQRILPSNTSGTML